MERDESQRIKGVAILLMLFLHLFNNQAVAEGCRNFFYVGDVPLAFFLTKACSPVGYFLIIGGYGLYKVYEKGDRHRWSRLMKLLIHFWVISFIFLTIGHLINPEKYPGTFLSVVKAFTTYEQVYNGEMWFLLPYMVLSALSPWIFARYAKIRGWIIIGVTLFLHLCTSYCISKYGPVFLYHNYWAYNPLLVLHLLFSFSLGAIAARSRFFERLKVKIKDKCTVTGWIAMGGVILLFTSALFFKYNFFYPFMMTVCIVLCPLPRIVDKGLIKLGEQSMNMWMVHTWFSVYLFHSFIYSFSYPLLIFAVLTIISYASSMLVNRICRPIENLVFSPVTR